MEKNYLDNKSNVGKRPLRIFVSLDADYMKCILHYSLNYTSMFYLLFCMSVACHNKEWQQKCNYYYDS